MPLHETGFFAKGDAKDMKILKLANGEPVILVGNNHGLLQAFN